MIPILIPAYQPSSALLQLVQSLLDLGMKELVIVNDGSDRDKEEIFSQLKRLGCHVVEHPHNRGKGAALKTGLAFIRDQYPHAAGVVTADADGQHRPKDIGQVMKALEEHGVVLGTRTFDQDNIPLRSRFGNRLSVLYFRLLTGSHCPDTQTGLRGFQAKHFDLLLSCEGERYEYEMNVLTCVADKKIPLHFVPVSTVYIDQNASSHFRPIRDSLRIYKNSLKFVASSLSCSVVDIGLFSVLNWLLRGNPFNILLSTVLARLVSGVLNFTLNKKWSFASRGKARREFFRYCVLFFCQMFLSFALVRLLSDIPFPAPLWKIPVDTLLFVVSFFIQRRWVYRKEEQDG